MQFSDFYHLKTRRLKNDFLKEPTFFVFYLPLIYRYNTYKILLNIYKFKSFIIPRTYKNITHNNTFIIEMQLQMIKTLVKWLYFHQHLLTVRDLCMNIHKIM